jgi:hypothetical protein
MLAPSAVALLQLGGKLGKLLSHGDFGPWGSKRLNMVNIGV